MYENSLLKIEVQENFENTMFMFAVQLRKYTVAAHCNPGDQRIKTRVVFHNFTQI